MRIVDAAFYRNGIVDVKFEHQMVTRRGGDEESQYIMYEAATGFEKARSELAPKQGFGEFQLIHIGRALTKALA